MQKNKQEMLKEIISQNFEVSIILPFYKKYNDFKTVLPFNAKYFQRNGIEVIISMDEPTEKENVINLIKEYPFINWKIFCNEKEHKWRNPSKAINVGIKHAKKKYILIMSPESELYNDVILELRYTIEFYHKHFVVGQVVFAEHNECISKKSLTEKKTYSFGSIMAKKEDFVRIKGYNEKFSEWGGDDSELRARLEIAGLKKMQIKDAFLIHRDSSNLNNQRNLRMKSIPIQKKRAINYPTKIVANGNWGNAFNKLIYDYKNNKYAYELCEKYLSSFLDFEIVDNNIFNSSYKVIALIQAYNEADMIEEALEHIGKHCDGIILLDDESTDGTYALADNDKLLIKVRKKRLKFDDISNRNILLNIASFLKSEWFYYMDVDERFDERYNDIYDEIEKSHSDVIAFYFINLWDSREKYRIDYPFFGRKNDIKGRGYRHLLRLFRNKGRMNIFSDLTLHFLPIPYKLKNDKDYYLSNVLVKHLGLLSRIKRVDKYNFYNVEDKKNDQESYEHLLDREVVLDLVTNFEIPSNRVIRKY